MSAESPLEALRKLLAMARGEWSNPDRRPADEPFGDCDWGDCDEPGTEWRWSEDHGGWLIVCACHEEAEVW